jgi:hypothetical protein
MLYLALARLPFSFRTVNLKTGVQRTAEDLAVNRWEWSRHCATATYRSPGEKREIPPSGASWRHR